MKKSPEEIVAITPAGQGWLLHFPGRESQWVSSLEEAGEALSASSIVRLALPTSVLVLERLTLPATEPEELAGMVRLQSEKSLPFSMEEVSNDFVTVESRPQESAVLSISAPHASLEALCQPLSKRHIIPERATPFVFHVAASCPPDEDVLAVYAEQGHLVVAIAESGKLSWAQTLDTTAAERFIDDLPQLLLPAMMEGVVTSFARIYLAADCADLAPAMQEFFEREVEPLPTPALDLALPINLAPASWQTLKLGQQKSRRLKKIAVLAAAGLALLLLAAVGYLAALKHKSANLAQQVAALRPKVELIQERQARAQSLGAAINPRRYTTEVLFLLIRNLPADSVRLTEFDQTATQWRIVGEASSANQATDYTSRIKSDQELGEYDISADPPRMLTNAHWQFSILGKQ